MIGLSGCKKELPCKECLKTNQATHQSTAFANAGNDTTIILPVNTVILNGSASLTRIIILSVIVDKNFRSFII